MVMTGEGVKGGIHAWLGPVSTEGHGNRREPAAGRVSRWSGGELIKPRVTAVPLGLHTEQGTG